MSELLPPDPPELQSEVGNQGGTVSSPTKDTAPGKSWANVVSEKPMLKQHHFDNINERGVVTVPAAVLGDTPLWDDLLVGQFVTKAPHVAKIHVIVNKIWPLGGKSLKIDVFVVSDKMVKFRVRDAAVRSRILRRGMWNIADVPMLVSKWTPILEDAQPAITSMPMWIKIMKVPHSMFSWEGLGFLASKVGKPTRLHPETETCKNFDEAKVFVEVDLMKTLPNSFAFELQKGIEAVVDYEYPWLPPRCTKCGIWGHFEDACKTSPQITILKRGQPISPAVLEVQQQAQITVKPIGGGVEIVTNTAAQSTVPVEKSTIADKDLIEAEPQEQGRDKNTTSNANSDNIGATVEQMDITDDASPENPGFNDTLTNEAQPLCSVSQEKIKETTEEEVWVSPTKLRKAADQKVEGVINISPSKFSILAVEENGQEENDDEDEVNTEVSDTEEGEIDDTNTPVSSKEKGVLRQSIPRASKSTHKILSKGNTKKVEVALTGKQTRGRKRNA